MENLVRARATLGDFEITILTDGTYYLDGGAMFGVIPKPLWEKRAPADEKNRILLGTNTVVVRDGKHTVVIETGIGNKLSPKQQEIYGNYALLPSAFAAAGIALEDVDVVINSHLHFDHCGWNTTQLPDGSVIPTFPNARYFAHQGEVEHGRLQLERDAVSYIAANYEPLIANGQMTLIIGPQEIVPGISVDIYPGHTAQMMAVNITSGGRTASYISDLIPTSAHLDLTWGMGYDLDPLRVISERKRFYSRAIPEQWLLLFTHDHRTPMGYVELNEKGRPVLRNMEGAR
ncbi:MAG TPA: MBL fold metallo-hydrolase [Acidobacteriaceae bacterium]|jgi:glyoxylase-like metal-dependent hydrolase (beta-lactamase superfamily II)|nr:MBL fold metallo-hydrolase [Acidobacteriaceae bacterium]